MKIRIHLHEKSFKNKPDKKDVFKLSNQITGTNFTGAISEIAYLVGEKGHTFMPAIMNGKRRKENFVSQQIFALDFDGGFTIESFMERAEKYEIMPAFIYETFSSTNVIQKFRAVFVNDYETQNAEIAEIMVNMLLKIFPEADGACKDNSRMFYGGKGLIYEGYENTINIFDTAISMQAYMKNTDPHNYARSIKQFGNKFHIAVNKNLLYIHRRCTGEIEENSANSNIIIETAQKSSIYYMVEKSEESQHSMQANDKKNHLKEIRGINEKYLFKECKLFSDFYSKDISHQQKYLIATNLLNVRGGKSLFFKGINTHFEKWKIDWEYMKLHQYHPQLCKNGECPYYEQCGSTTIIDKLTQRTQKIADFEYGTLEESAVCLQQYMEEAIFDMNTDIHLISAQTALGKTTAYCDIIAKHCGKIAFMVVVPTNKLQQEVAYELEKRDINVFTTPNIKNMVHIMGFEELENEISQLYAKGFGFKVKSHVCEFIDKHKNELSEWQKIQFEKYLCFKDNLDGTTCVVTTHSMFLALEHEILKKYRVIVDEDIIMTIFKNTASMDIEEVELLLQHKKLTQKQYNLIKGLLNQNDGSIIKNDALKLERAELEELYDMELSINGAVADFLQADAYHIDYQNDRINYFIAKQLPKAKMVIVSATLNPRLYDALCLNRIIKSKYVPIASYKGKLKQYTAHSLSRSNIEMLGYQKVTNSICKIVNNKEANFITFRKYDSVREIYFGKTEGYNEYKGKDLAVIGTPHNVPFVYRLIGTYLGYQAESSMSVNYVEHNGYMFKFMTFNDEDMQNLQFYFIKSELEQAIGRARILRYDCTVFLFSNFPMKQAEIIQEEYLMV